ncbi:tetratricopeptide repeat protein [Acidiphilium sp.]|uniref:tetratricopeptide repeat protein n=1 Tax=Acidiphilium sp. TaxID=527 RepID=UPI003D064113
MADRQSLISSDAVLVHAYRSLLTQAPDSAVILGLLAQALYDAGDYQGAVEAADEALGIDPGLVDARQTRAAALQALCDFGAAAADFTLVAAAQPDRIGVQINRAIAYAESDRPGEAVACLHGLIARHPDCAAAYAVLGSIHARFEAVGEALAACRQAVALDPDQIIAHRNLAALLLDEHPAEALRHEAAAYRQQQVFVPAMPPLARRVLVLTCGAAASVPLAHLLPRPRYAQIQWFIDYARPEQDRMLPDHDLIFNAIGDPDLMPALAAPVRRLLQETTRPILNHPDRVGQTQRSALPGMMAGLPDIVVPQVIRLGRGDDAALTIARPPTTARPVIVRPIGSHGGSGLVKASSVAEIAAVLARHDAVYVTDFVEYRRADDGLYRKYRMIFVDRVPYPYHLAIARDWLVHYWTAGMADAPARRAEEERFLNDPAGTLGERGLAAVTAIGARLDLDYAGIDFSLLPDGRVLVFEANATMLVHPETEPMFAYKNPAVTRILTAVDRMVTDRLAFRDDTRQRSGAGHSGILPETVATRLDARFHQSALGSRL